MISKLKYFSLLLVVCLGLSMSVSAKVERTTVYMFGFSASFTDSLVYITDIQQLDSAYIDTKTKFLFDRVVYSDQLQTYLEGINAMPDCTCVVFFNTKKKKLEEDFRKIKNRYEKDPSLVLKTLTATEFYFQAPAFQKKDERAEGK